jgi:hypothetical protein
MNPRDCQFDRELGAVASHCGEFESFVEYVRFPRGQVPSHSATVLFP